MYRLHKTCAHSHLASAVATRPTKVIPSIEFDGHWITVQLFAWRPKPHVNLDRFASRHLVDQKNKGLWFGVEHVLPMASAVGGREPRPDTARHIVQIEIAFDRGGEDKVILPVQFKRGSVWLANVPAGAVHQLRGGGCAAD